MNDNKTLNDIIMGEKSFISWNDIKEIQNNYNDFLNQNYGIANFTEYALKSFFVFSNAVGGNEFCVKYRTKNNSKSNFFNVVKKDKSDNGFYQTCGLLTNIENGNVWIKDTNDITTIFYCNKCMQTYWGKYRKEETIGGQKVLLEEGQQCDKTLGCKGTLVKSQTHSPKNLLIGNIEEIFNKKNEQLNFQPFLKKVSYYLKQNRINDLDKKIYEVSKRFEENISPTQENVTKQEDNIIKNSNNMVSLAQMKKKKNKEYEELKKNVWTPNNEATYDYWAELYGRGMNPEDTEKRKDFADAMVQNN